MIDYTALDKWLAQVAQPVDETGIHKELQHLVMCGSLADAASICLIYALGADGYGQPQKVGVLTGSPDQIREALKEICGISQRGVESRFGFFRLMLVSSPEEAEVIVQAICDRLGIRRAK